LQLKSPENTDWGFLLSERTLEDAKYHSTWSQITPMGRPAYSSDIAAAALFLVLDQAKHITGQSLVIDGGWTCKAHRLFDFHRNNRYCNIA
jgi:NAD(P)-dependent dehydrogenase (short-subunit alcohol dehydrogenase family)